MSKIVLNRIKVALAEKGKTNKWLAEKLDKNETTISRWCTNEMQLSLETLMSVATVLGIDVRQLLISNRES